MLADTAPGFLKRGSVSELTAARYEEASEDFHSYCALTGLCCSSLDDADGALCAYFEALFINGESKAAARYTLYGIAWTSGWPTRGSVFPQAKQAMKGWGKLEPDSSRPPCPWESVLLIVDELLISHSEPLPLLAACATLLAFDTYMRPSETLSLHGEGIPGRTPRTGVLWALGRGGGPSA